MKYLQGEMVCLEFASFEMKCLEFQDKGEWAGMQMKQDGHPLITGEAETYFRVC